MTTMKHAAASSEETKTKQVPPAGRQFTAQDYAAAEKYREEIAAIVDAARRGILLQR